MLVLLFRLLCVTILLSRTERRPMMTTQSRIITTINADWRFRYFPRDDIGTDFARPDFDDARWKPVAVPHTWSTFETTGQVHPFVMNASEEDDRLWWHGWGCYRKTLRFDRKLRGKKIFLEFDGVQKYTRLLINGRPVGEHKGGYTSFCFDITDHILFDAPTVLALAVSNRRDDLFGGIPPMTAGNFNVYGGIYRDVRLVVKNPVYIPFQGSAEHEGGTFVTTPVVSRESATVRVRTYVKNELDRTEKCLVTHLIRDPEGKAVIELCDEEILEPGRICEFDRTSEPIASPRLWSPEQPALYSVHTTVTAGGQTVDEYESPLGFRWFHWDYSEKRLYWNGKSIHIHGANRHQEYPWLGDAVPKWIHEMDMMDIRYNLGHNFMRTAHYPQDPCIYDFCDRHGIIVCEEVPNIKKLAFSDQVQEQNLREMIRRDRNHPSIAMWSLGNETHDAADPDWARQEDDTRMIHCRKAIGRGSDAPHDHHQLDMEHLLRCTVRGWYNRDVRDSEPEYGQHTGHETWQHDMAMVDGANIRGRVDKNGVMWIYADHGADREYAGCPLKHINPKGWVDAYRIPKYMYYLWQANWCEYPMVYIHPWDWTSGYLGRKRTIVVNSNCDAVELKVNGVSQGKLIPGRSNFYTVRFPGVTVQEGVVTAVGERGGEYFEHSVTMAGPPAAIALDVEQREITADRAGIALIRVDIVDENGVHVFGARPGIRLDVGGPAVPTAPALFTSDIDRKEEMEGTMYIDTPFVVPIRSTQTPGTITVRASSEGLTGGAITVKSVLPEERITPGITVPRIEGDAGNVSALDETVDFAEEEFAAGALPGTATDIDLTGCVPGEYAARLDTRIREENPGVDFAPAAFNALKDVFLEHLDKNSGMLVRDDYNFLIQRYNLCERFSALVDSMSIPEESAEQLKAEYAEQIIRRGRNMDFSAERERLGK